MLPIILLILKIIGILLLCVLGLILLLLIVTLFVPVRYRVILEHGEELFLMKGRVHWLLHLLHISITHLDGILHIQARILGLLIYDNLKPKKPKVSKEKTKRETSNKRNSKTTNKTRKKTDKMDNGQKSGNVREEMQAVTEKSITDKPVIADKAVITNKAVITDKAVITEDAVITDKPVITQEQSDSIVTNPEALQMDKSLISKTTNFTTKNEISGNTNTKVINSKPEPDQNKKKESFFRKLVNRVKRLKIKILSVIRSLRDKIGQIITNISTIRNKGDLILKFLKNERNKEGLHLTLLSLKKLLKHVLPQKVRSKLVFGTGDPCSTGQALGAMSILYSFYGDNLSITPDFERNRLEGQHFIKGRIRLVTILIIVGKLIFDKRFKQLKNNFSILKEAL